MSVDKLKLVASDYNKEAELNYLQKNMCPICGVEHSYFLYTYIGTSPAGILSWDVHCTECNSYFNIDVTLQSMYKITLKEVE